MKRWAQKLIMTIIKNFVFLSLSIAKDSHPLKMYLRSYAFLHFLAYQGSTFICCTFDCLCLQQTMLKHNIL